MANDSERSLSPTAGTVQFVYQSLTLAVTMVSNVLLAAAIFGFKSLRERKEFWPIAGIFARKE